MASSVVRVKTALLIPPSDPTPYRTLALSSLDSQLFLRFNIEYLLIYSPSKHHDKAASAARLKIALAKALVHYYPLAGRVRTRAEGSGLDVLCHAQGAGFIEAVSNDNASVFEHAPNSVSEWRKLLNLEAFKILPPLVVQLTWLADGSAALAVGFAHCVCDGVGSMQFLKMFAELSRGKSRIGEVKQVPIWDRHLMDLPFFSISEQTETGYHPEFIPVPDTCGFLSRFSREKLIPTSITFDKSGLNELKKLAGELKESTHGYTSFEVLSAHIWRSWAISLNLPPEQNLKLLFSVNVRNRVDQSLPAGYYGNAFVLGCAETNAEDIVEKGLGYVSGLVKKAKDRVGNEYVREVVDIVSKSGREGPDSVGVLIISQWSRLGLDRIDFGFGRPVHMGPVCCDRYCLMLPVQDRMDAVKVMVAVPTCAVDRFEYLLRCPYS